VDEDRFGGGACRTREEQSENPAGGSIESNSARFRGYNAGTQYRDTGQIQYQIS